MVALSAAAIYIANNWDKITAAFKRNRTEANHTTTAYDALTNSLTKKNSSGLAQAIAEVYLLREAMLRAAAGSTDVTGRVQSQQAVLDQYNETLGKVVGTTDNWNELIKNYTANAEYIANC